MGSHTRASATNSTLQALPLLALTCIGLALTLAGLAPPETAVLAARECLRTLAFGVCDWRQQNAQAVCAWGRWECFHQGLNLVAQRGEKRHNVALLKWSYGDCGRADLRNARRASFEVSAHHCSPDSSGCNRGDCICAGALRVKRRHFARPCPLSAAFPPCPWRRSCSV